MSITPHIDLYAKVISLSVVGTKIIRSRDLGIGQQVESAIKMSVAV